MLIVYLDIFKHKFYNKKFLFKTLSVNVNDVRIQGIGIEGYYDTDVNYILHHHYL